MTSAFIISPNISKISLGPLSIHLYAICIIIGIFVGIWLTERRWVARGGRPGLVGDVAIVAVPAGILGGRIYHILTTPEKYFGASGHPVDVFKIWEGGLGIWGAISLGAFGAWLSFRRRGETLPFASYADAIAPGLLFAQAIGRWGNWFNIELFGKPSTLPWALEVPFASRPSGYEQFATFAPTFLYESLWCIAIAFVLLFLDGRVNWQPGAFFALYVGLYCVGRLWIEALRIDPAHLIAGVRLNDWVSAIVGAMALIVWVRLRKPPRGVTESTRNS